MNIAKTSQQVSRDINIGDKESIETLFPWQDYDEVKKVFEISKDIHRDMPLSIHVGNFGSIEVSADIDKKVDQKPLPSLWMLLSFDNLRKKMACTKPAQKGEWLDITITSA